MKPIFFLFAMMCFVQSCSEGKADSEEKSDTEVSDDYTRFLKFPIQEYEHCTEISDDKENYDTMCNCIEAFDLQFPTKKVKSGMLIKNTAKSGERPFLDGPEYSIDAEFISSFEKLTQDSSNFGWGEAITTYSDYRVEFYSENGDVINHAEISFDGMLWVEPKLGTTKWGSLEHNAGNEMRRMVNRIVKKTDTN